MEVGLQAKLSGDKSKKGKLKRGRKEGIYLWHQYTFLVLGLNSVVTFIVPSMTDTQGKDRHFC